VDIVNRFATRLEDVSKIEREAKSEGRKVTLVLCPKK
jgi:translation initiation factor IF-3